MRRAGEPGPEPARMMRGFAFGGTGGCGRTLEDECWGGGEQVRESGGA